MSVKNGQKELNLDDVPNHDEVHYANEQLRLYQRQQRQQMQQPVREQQQQQQQRQEIPAPMAVSEVMAQALRIGDHAHPLMRIV
jgi:hypothetical protein